MEPQQEEEEVMAAGGKAAGGEDKERPASPQSPEPGCVICLGKLENKSFTDSCFHQFCFTCLLEWSKVKAECPLCKQPFNSIIHNVRSNEDYDQYHLRPQDVASSWPEGRRFRYRSTLTAERRREMALHRLFAGHVRHQADEMMRYHWQRRVQQPTPISSEFRREIYEQDVWAVPLERMPTPPARYRDISAAFFHANPACTHRLMPWLNRELVVLLSNQEVQIRYILDLVVSLIQRYDILSPEFRERVYPYFGSRTDHFVHEFYNYARSPWDMIGYDRHVSYQHATRNHVDDEVIVLSPNEPTPPTQRSQTPELPTSVSSTSSFPEPSSSLQGAGRDLLPNVALDNVRKFLSTVNAPGGEWESPTLAPQPDAWESPYAVRRVDQNRGGEASPQPGPSGIGRTLSVHDSSDSDFGAPSCVVGETPAAAISKFETVDDSDEECHVVGYVKPITERTPELVDLVSDSEVWHDELPSSRRRRKTRSPSAERSEARCSSSARNDSSCSRPTLKSHCVPVRKENASKGSSQHWRWTAYEGGGGKFQRTYSPPADSSSSSSYRPTRRSGSGERAPTSEKHKRRHSSKRHKKHKKHKHKHSHKEEKRSRKHRGVDKKHSKSHKRQAP